MRSRLTMFGVLVLGGIARACPNCRDAVPVTEAAPVPAYNASIYLMLGVFLATLGFVTVSIVRAARKR